MRVLKALFWLFLGGAAVWYYDREYLHDRRVYERPARHPTPVDATPDPFMDQGKYWVISANQGAGNVLMARSRQAYDKADAYAKAGNAWGVMRMMDHREVWTVQTGSICIVVEVYQESNACRVRLADGREGVLKSSFVRAVE